MSELLTSGIFAIVVTYRPDTGRLTQIFESVSKQCRFIVADNSSNPSIGAEIEKYVKHYRGVYLTMEGNRGIGFAQNAAIAEAWKLGATAVLLLDDDSIPDSNLVKSLTIDLATLDEKAIVSARAVDQFGCEISNVRPEAKAFSICREMMSSGTLIRREIFDRVGQFDEELFIDCVDFDWGWRAQSLGMKVYITRSTSVQHRLGEGKAFGVRLPAPIRHYYQYRNIPQLMWRSYTPLLWKLEHLIKLPIKIGLMILVMPERWRRFRYAVYGLIDAFRGITGAFPEGK